MLIPENTGACIDALYELRQTRLQLQREFDAKLKEMKAEEKELEDVLFVKLGNEGLEGAKGTVATAGLKHTTVPQPKDWDAIYKFIKENDAFDLLHKRFTSSAWAERVEAGQEIPGIETFDKVEITLNKR